MWNWIKEFIRDYAVWTVCDWLVYTQSGHAFCFLIAGAIMTATARLLPWLESWKHDIGVAVVVLFISALLIAVVEGYIALAKSRKTPLPAAPTLTDTQEQKLHETVTKWLKSRLSDHRLKIQHCGLFGSILRHHYPTSDVDLAVLIEPLSEWRFRHIAKQIRTVVASEFREQYGHRLRVNFFTASEQSRFREFCERDTYEALI